jgi:hypothetical protein
MNNMILTPKQEMMLQDISDEVALLVLSGKTDIREIATQIACHYFNGTESDEIIELIGDEIMLTKMSILN